MTTSIAIEEECGTGTGLSLEHNGYYAGDFWASRQQPPAPAPSIADVVARLSRRLSD